MLYPHEHVIDFQVLIAFTLHYQDLNLQISKLIQTLHFEFILFYKLRLTSIFSLSTVPHPCFEFLLKPKFVIQVALLILTSFKVLSFQFKAF